MSFNKRQTLIGTLSNFIGQICRKGLAFLITILLIRFLTVEEYGEFNIFIATMTLIGSISLGGDKVLQRFFPHHLKHKKDNAIALFKIMLIYRYLIISTLCLGTYLLAKIGILDVNRFNFHHLDMAVIAGIVMATQIYAMTTLNATYMDLKFINSVYIFGDILKLSFLYLLFKGDLSIAINIYTFGEGLVLIAIVLRLFKKIGLPLKHLISAKAKKLELKRYFQYAKYMILATTGTYILSTHIDFYFISYFNSNTDVGIYAFSAKIAFLLLLFAPSNLMFNVNLPIFFNKVDNGAGIENLYPYLELYLKINIVVWSIIIAVFYANSKWIILHVFSSEYLKSVPYILFWFFILYANIIKSVFEPVTRSIEYTKSYLWTFYAAFLNVLGNFFLIPILGIIGALISTGFAILIQGIGLSLSVVRKINFPLKLFIQSLLVFRIFFLGSGLIILNYYGERLYLNTLAYNLIVFIILLVLFWPKFFLNKEEINLLDEFTPIYFQKFTKKLISTIW